MTPTPAGARSWGAIRAVRRHPLLTLAAVAALSTIAVAIVQRVGGPPGLLLTVALTADTASTPLHSGIDDILTRQNSERLAMLGGGRPVQLRWDGYLWVNEAREYEVRVASDVPARLWLNGHIVFDSLGGDVPPSRVRMQAGLQLIQITYGPATRSARFGFEWDDESPYRLTAVPRSALSPRSLEPSAWAAHLIAPDATATVAMLWFAVICCAAAAPVWQLARRNLTWTPALTITFAGSALLFVLGIWWGGTGTWAPDEMTPGYILKAMQQHVGQGWYDRYPPLHLYVIAIAYLPLAAAHSLHWLSLYSAVPDAVMVAEARIISVLMGMATLVAVALLADPRREVRLAGGAVHRGIPAVCVLRQAGQRRSALRLLVRVVAGLPARALRTRTDLRCRRARRDRCGGGRDEGSGVRLSTTRASETTSR